MMRVFFDPSIDAMKLRQYAKVAQSCERSLMEQKEDKPRRNGLLKENLRRESESLASSSALHKNGILDLLRE